jgi:hypothetical protein
VPVYDLVFQDRDHALVAGTHGRSIWVLDHIEPLAELGAQGTGDGRLFAVPPVYHKVIYPGQFWFGAGEFFAPNPSSGAILTWYLPQAAGATTISIADAAGKTIRTLRGPSQAGMNRACWDLRREAAFSSNPSPLTTVCDGSAAGGGPLAPPGKYTATLLRDGAAPLETAIAVLPDPHFAVTAAERTRRNTAIMAAYTLQQQLIPARDAAQVLVAQMSSLRQAAGAAREAVDGVNVAVTGVQRQIAAALSSAARVQNAMDSFSGVPTAAQLRELDWAWEDATAAVSTLNRLIGHEVPAAYAAAGGGVRAAEVTAVPVPVRRK